METQLTTSQPSSLATTGQNWPDLIRFAEFVCKADLMPAHLKNKPADCLLVAMQAQRWRMDFFAVAQCTSIVRGKPMYEGKLVVAAINTSGLLEGSLNHSFTGDKPPALSVMIVGKLKGENEPREWEVSWAEGFAHAQDKAQWQSSPKKRLLYFATREWARVHMPEVMLGVRADDETLSDGSNVEAVQATSQPISTPPARRALVEASAQTVEVMPTCWADLWDNNAWRNVAVPTELKLTSGTVGVLQRNREELVQADKQAKDGSNLRFALDCLRWAGIERTLAGMNMTGDEFVAKCRQIGLLGEDQGPFDTTTEQLAQLAVGARNIQLAKRQQDDRENARTAQAESESGAANQ